MANGAVYFLSPKAIDRIKSIEKKSSTMDFSVDIIPSFLGKIFTYETSHPFVDIGTPTNYTYANSVSKYYDNQQH